MTPKDLSIFKQTVILDENDCIFIQPICDFFDINRENQLRIIQNDAVLASLATKKSNDLVFGDSRQRTSLSKKGFIRWIQLLNPNIVKPELREKLMEYQQFVFDYIYGEALVPNVRREYAIEVQKKQLNKQIAELKRELTGLETERKQLKLINYQQLGLDFRKLSDDTKGLNMHEPTDDFEN